MNNSTDQVAVDWEPGSGKQIEQVQFADSTWTKADLQIRANRAPTLVAALTNQTAQEASAWNFTVPSQTFTDPKKRSCHSQIELQPNTGVALSRY